MSRKFREWQPDAGWLFPPSPRDWLPEDHLVYCLLDVTARIDISPIRQRVLFLTFVRICR
ncbi:MAG: hypothetical protein ACKVII_08420 [Planctomycetales bacterium]|jgi:hypothetical protein